jgi:surfactin family lipopeptide synthetase C
MSRQAIEDIYPLSPTQQGMLFHSLYSPQSGVYVVQVGCTVRGVLDLQALAHAWQQLVQRHPVLRTAFVWTHLEEPLQVAGRQATVPLTYEDWRQHTREELPEELDVWMAQDRAQGFDLTSAPLMRLTIMQLSDNAYRMIWTYHHLLLDGWSASLLLQELLICYQATRRGQTPALPIRRPYRDYIAWLQQQDVEVAVQFWKQRLHGLTSPTPLSIECPGYRQAVTAQIHHAAEQRQLTLPLSQQLHRLARRERLTLNTLVQGAWAIVLSRYSGESEVLFGVTCAGRPTALRGADIMVGLFINTLPMRVDTAPQQCLRPWLQHLQAQQLAQQPYEYTPLVRIHGCSEISRALPLFESVVVFENYPVEPAFRQGAQTLRIDDVVIAEQTNYPLTLFAIADDILTLKVLYDCDRFTAGAMTRLLGHLETVLGGLVAAPEMILETLTLLSAEERQQVLSAWNETSADLELLCVHEYIALQAARTPEATAVICGHQSLSYRELNTQADQLAAYLRMHGVQGGDRVGLCVERSLAMLVGLLGILKAGGAYVPLDPSYPCDRLGFTVADAGIKLLLATPEAASSASALPISLNIVDLMADWERVAQKCLDHQPSPSHPDDVAYVIYTSGSTGRPKGVPIRHRSLSNLLYATAQRLALTVNDTLLAVTTLAFDISALELFLPLIVGGRVVLATSPGDGRYLQQQLAHHQVTVMQATPSTWRLLFDSGWQGQDDLTILCGGEALDTQLARQLLSGGRALWNMYGPTETTIWSGALHLSEERLAMGITPIGQPLANTQFYVLDRQQQPVPIGVPGELYIGGAGLSPGYLHRDDLTQASFICNPLRAPYADESPRLYKTGDRVRYLEDGTLEFLGRLDSQIKLRGFRIELGEIETVLAQHPSIAQALVMLRQDDPENPQLVAYLIRSGADDISSLSTAMRQYLEQTLPAYMIPAAYVVLDAYPLTPNGKVDRQALPALSGHRPVRSLTVPQTQAEKAIATIWQAVLGIDRVGLHDNFFDLGGHSLLMVKVHDQLHKQLSLDMPLVELFRYPTVRSLATYMHQREAEDDATPQLRTDALEAGKQRLHQRLRQRASQREVQHG